ncbi:MAG: thiamine phosphate synthase [Hyphomonadaceae bacterium]
MRSHRVLASLAARLNRDAGAPAIPSLFFFTDPERTPDPVAAAQRLPRGTVVVYRHFGAPERVGVARRLSETCRSRGLVLVIGADVELARRCHAAGVHWPERLMPIQRGGEFRLVTAAAHGAAAVAAAARARLDACVLSPVFPTRSAAERQPLGLFRASQIARASPIPVIALGGVRDARARQLVGRGFAGLAAVEALVDV